jgi:hypothetical protein
VVITFSCTNDNETRKNLDPDLPQLSLLESENTGIDFQNKITETADRNLGLYDYFFNGSGVAIADFNNDQLPDVFFCGNDADNTLYFNKGNFQFEDVTAQAGLESNGKWSTGVTVVDINEDGWLDIYVCNSGPYNDVQSLRNQLYINNKDGSFSEQASYYGIAEPARSTQASFFDMDKDGDLDLFVMNHSLRNRGASLSDWFKEFEMLPPEVKKKEINTLYRNNGNGTFTDITEQAGINKVGFGLGLAISDLDDNGYLDIYVANDYFIPDFIFLNNGNGTFIDKARVKASHISYYSMGCDIGDINNDGLQDIAVVDMTPSDHFRNKTLMASMSVENFYFLDERMKFTPQYMFNSLQLNRGKGIYSEIGLMAGVSQTDWSWAALLADFDNDGLKDFLVSNGYWRDTKDNDWRIKLQELYSEKGESLEVYFEHLQTAPSVAIPNYIYQNNGDYTFSDKSRAWGFAKPSFSHGVAYGDLDKDGDLDIIVNNLGDKAFVYQNNAREKSGENYIQFQLEGKWKENANAIVEIAYEGKKQVVEYHFTRGYQSSMEPLAHFGLGKVATIENAKIRWQDGSTYVLQQPKINQLHTISKKDAKNGNIAPSQAKAPFVDISSQQKLVTFQHTENDFNDFDREVLLPHRQSKLGPCVAVADINGDGLDDFYIGGASGQAGQLYTQLPNMIFTPSEDNIFQEDVAKEDIGASFFDADNDGDLDLYVASGGGGEMLNQINKLQDRLYINNGAGQFSKSKKALPSINTSTSSIAAVDWDNDGDQDLFIGGRNDPGNYPNTPQSYLLSNEDGKFKDVTKQVLGELEYLGMITDAIWRDIDKDGWQDLIIVGEWMPITILKNENGKLSNKSSSTALANQKGWWYQIESGDFDKDGDLDFIVGNIGLNNKFHPSDKKNLHVFWNDFDDNRVPDIVLSKHYKDNIVPVRGKECSTEQMHFLDEKFMSSASFASSSLEDIYGKEKLEESLHLTVNNFASVYLENKGNFEFDLHQLPQEAQIAPINSIVVNDFDKDGLLDAIIGGNMFETEVETPAYDAGKGLFLKGKGNGQFTASLNMQESGLFLHKNVKAMELLQLGPQKQLGLLVGNNDASPQIYIQRN